MGLWGEAEMKKLIFVLGLLGWASLAAGESRSCFLRRCSWYGLDDRRGKLDLSLNGGVGLCQIESMTSTLSSGSARPNYQWSQHARLTPKVSFLAVYQQGILGFDTGVEYYSLRSKLDKTFADRMETYTFEYSYIGISATFRIFLYKGLYMGLGGAAGYNITPKLARVQSTWFSGYAGDEFQLQKRLDETFEGNWTAGPVLKVGYDFSFGLALSVEYYYGAGDHLRAAENNYDYHEVLNDAHRAVLSIGYNITIFDYETGRKEPGWKKWER